jgi:hypothetical protein
VDDLVCRLQVGLDRPAELDQPRQLGRLDPLLERGVEGAAEGDVDLPAGRRQPARMHERRDVPEAHRDDAAALDTGNGVEAPRRDVDDDLRAVDTAALDRPRDERDRPVPAGGRVARIVEEDDAEVGAAVLGLGDEAAVHVGVAARLVDEQPPDVVEMLEREAPLVEDRAPLERRHAAGDDAERLAAGVVVGSRDHLGDRIHPVTGTVSPVNDR